MTVTSCVCSCDSGFMWDCCLCVSATTARRKQCITVAGIRATAPSSVNRSTGTSSINECVDVNATDSADTRRRERPVPFCRNNWWCAQDRYRFCRQNCRHDGLYRFCDWVCRRIMRASTTELSQTLLSLCRRLLLCVYGDHLSEKPEMKCRQIWQLSGKCGIDQKFSPVKTLSWKTVDCQLCVCSATLLSSSFMHPCLLLC